MLDEVAHAEGGADGLDSDGSPGCYPAIGPTNWALSSLAGVASIDP
jgi:hypothetical protein